MAEKSERFLVKLFEDTDSKERRTAIETLITLYRNLLKGDEKFKTIRISNSTFHDRVWKHIPVRSFLLHNGWRVLGTDLVFRNTVPISDALDLLLEYRNVVPADEEWDDGSKFEGLSREQLRERELRAKAVQERNKELEEFMRDKRERDELAKNIKKQIASDRRNRREILTPSVANELGKRK